MMKKLFKIVAQDGLARTGTVQTGHGSFKTPAFMPVGTQASVKAVAPDRLKNLGAEILLSNTYHLHVRPGEQTIGELGGLHRFMGWDGPILTDSGGFQVFSLSGLRTVKDEGVTFQSHVDGAKLFFSPEKVIEIQRSLGVDVMMVLDECLPYPASRAEAQVSLDRTLDWARRSLAVRPNNSQLVFGIVQGGMYQDLREHAAESLSELEFDGYAVGGLSVGEPLELMGEMTQVSVAKLPQGSPRYLMGVGTPSDIVRAVGQGIDMFDCVIPTRSARFGRLFTEEGFINIKNNRYRRDPAPIDSACDCLACHDFSRAYLCHLIHANEVLYLELASIHNLRFYLRLIERIRCSIEEGKFAEFSKEFIGNRVEQGAAQDPRI